MTKYGIDFSGTAFKYRRAKLNPGDYVNITEPSVPMGGESVPVTTRENEVARFVYQEHRAPLLLALSMYSTPVGALSGFILVSDLTSVRVGVWFRDIDALWVVACKGTQPFGESGAADLKDDSKIAFGSYCDLSLVEETKTVIETILDMDNELEDIMVVGHSLGGSAALCVSAKYGIRCASFNGGAAPTNPVLSGPGPQLATHYHIFGDLISSHMSPQAALVVRVRTPETNFGSLYPHSSARFLEKSGPFTIVTADEEDEAYLNWGRQFKWSFSLLPKIFTLAGFLATLKKYQIVRKSPIPGSTRALQTGS